MGDRSTLPVATIEPCSGATTPEGFLQRQSLHEPVLIRVRDWTLGLSHPVARALDLSEVSGFADFLGWREPRPPGPPFSGALAGFMTDATGRGLLRIQGTDLRPAPSGLPPVSFGLYDTAVCWDAGGRAFAVAARLPGFSAEPLDVRLARAREWLSPRPPAPAVELPPRQATTSLSRAAHVEAVTRIKSWIAAGDLYQLNLTFQVRVPWPLDGAALARRLWAASPGAAHAAWLRTRSGAEIVSISPETFLRTDSDRVVVRPIKGTRPRHPDPRLDEQAGHDLRASAKDRAEHIMIVDLERNDLGRVCRTGTVHVPELAALEGHPTVWHLTSTVEGRLLPGLGLQDLFASMFPCGSVTGAPKRMAVSRLGLVEPLQRGVYCGAIGIVSRGLTDFSVAIRTAVVADGIASYGAGGGIVADSDPDEEWHEAIDKARAFLTATNAYLGRA